MKFSAFFIHAPERGAFEKAICLGKLLGYFHTSEGSRQKAVIFLYRLLPVAYCPLSLIVRRGKAFASLCATALKHKLAALCAHTHAKTMRFGAAAVVRLKSPLCHTIHLSINVSAEKIKAIGRRGWLSRLARRMKRRW